MRGFDRFGGFGPILKDFPGKTDKGAADVVQ